MLTYEYVSNKILVAYRDSYRLINKDLLIAFCIATIVHLSFLFVFRIKEFNFFLKYQPTIEFKVESDLTGALSIDTAQTCLDRSIVNGPCLKESFSIPQMTLTKTFDQELLFLRDQIIEPFFENHFTKRAKLPLELVLSHQLFGREIANKALLPTNDINEEGTVIFRVQVDDTTGRVFWSELVHSSGSRELDKRAIELLSQLEFVAHGNFMSLGEIEFHFHPQEDEHV